ncbi:MAG: transcription elongation factor GreA [Anaerolineales bacterium]|jgi:transcription elongation factor GreA
MDNDDIFLTKDGADKLRKDLEILRGPRRQEIASRLRHAIQQGDLTENANYISAKEDQAFLEGKIMELEDVLRRAIVIEESPQEDEVSIGSTVVVAFEDDSKQTFHVVGVKEADPRRGKISHQSPLGMALLGKRPGETARAETPSGPIALTVIEIR